jgi:hypothetical protein
MSDGGVDWNFLCRLLNSSLLVRALWDISNFFVRLFIFGFGRIGCNLFYLSLYCLYCLGHGLVVLSGDSFLVRGISNSSLFAESIIILNIDIDVDSQLLQRSRSPMVLIPSLPRC